MAIVIDGGRVPNLLALKSRPLSQRSADNREAQAGRIRIALINNMPDAALEDTEVQFYEVLDAAAGDIPISLKLFSLPDLPRGEAGQRRLNSFYFDISQLLNSGFDGVIITETRPRHPVRDKQFCVFEYKKVRDHLLTKGVGDKMQIPHSRWNEVRVDALSSCGYEVLMQSAQAGVDLFVKKKKDSLFVHFQGHPEYGTRTLLKEYRRDIKRFLRKERETYPNMPHQYFDDA